MASGKTRKKALEESLEKKERAVMSDLPKSSAIRMLGDAVAEIGEKDGRERFYMMTLTESKHPIAAYNMRKGTAGRVEVPMNSMCRTALSDNAHYVITMHNHPGERLSGLSEADISSAECTSRALALIGVRLLDEISVAGVSKRFCSCADTKSLAMIDLGAPHSVNDEFLRKYRESGVVCCARKAYAEKWHLKDIDPFRDESTACIGKKLYLRFRMSEEMQTMQLVETSSLSVGQLMSCSAEQKDDYESFLRKEYMDAGKMEPLILGIEEKDAYIRDRAVRRKELLRTA